MHSTPSPHPKRVRVGGSPAGKDRSPRVAIVPDVAKVAVSRHVQIEAREWSVGSQAYLARRPRKQCSLGVVRSVRTDFFI